MRRETKAACTLLCMAGILAGITLAHGGNYQGPQGGGSPTFAGPHGGGTGGTGGNSGGGNPHGGTSGGGNPGGNTGGHRPPIGAPSRPPGPTTGRGPGGTTGGKKATDSSDGDWAYWWELNDDQFLNVKAIVRANLATTSNIDRLLGDADGDVIDRVGVDQTRRDIIPTLKLGLKDAFFDARAAAAIALGKAAGNDDTEVEPALVAMLKDTDLAVRESACLGLGLHGSKDAVPVLLRVMKGEEPLGPDAKRGGGRHERAFAAVAIGMIGSRVALDPAVVNELVVAMKTNGAHADFQVGPALALGLMKAREAVPEILNGVALNADVDEAVRAHAVAALGKIGDASVVTKLANDCLNDKSAHVARSAAIALGLLTPAEDDATIETLGRFARSPKDRALADLCLIALGKTGSAKARDLLVGAVKKGQFHDRTFGALGLAIYGQQHRGERKDIGAIVLDAWNTTKSDSERGAYAVALGLLEHGPAVQSLSEELKTGGSPQLKGYVALAVGMIGATSEVTRIRDLVKSSPDLDTQRRAAIALGLLRDREAVPMLIKLLDVASGNLTSLGSTATALGFIGDRSAVGPLNRLLANVGGAAKDNARAFAAVALGLLGDKDELGCLSKLQEDCNYLATTPALAELLTIY